jgi:tetratricopeptide (TPR) repeat protein
MGLARLLRSTALAAVVTAMAAPPAGLAAPSEGAGPPPQTVRVGQADQFSRIELPMRDLVSSRREGQDLVLLLRGQPDIARLKTAPTKLVKSVTSSKVAHGLEVKVTLADGVDAKVGRDGGDAYIHIFTPPPVEAASTEAPAAPVRADPRPASGVVRVAFERKDGQLFLRFPWAAPAGAAVFRRGDGVWVVFDTAVRLDLSAAPKENLFYDKVQAIQGDGFSALRFSAPDDAVIHAIGEGNVWAIAFGPGQQPRPQPVKVTRAAETGPPTLQAEVAGATKVVWLPDPVVGDRIAAVTALGPTKGMPSRREFVDLALLPSMQGLAVEPIAEDVEVVAEGELVRLTSASGLTLSSLAALSARNGVAAGLPQPAVMPAVIDFARWSKVGSGGFLSRYGALQDYAAEEVDRQAKGDKATGVGARMALARFLAGSELSFEAIGVLDKIARSRPEVMDNAEFRGLRGAAKVMAGRYKEAQLDLSVPVLSDDPSAALWRGYVAAELGQWKDAAAAFQQGLPAMNMFAAPWQAKFARAHAEAALALGDQRTAKTQVALALAQSKDPFDQLQTYLIQAKLLEAQGSLGRALNVYDAVSRAGSDQVSAPALMNATRIRLQQGQLTPMKAAEIYDGLRYRWRGDATELETIRLLGGVYLSHGRYREALEVLRTAGQRMPDSPEAVQLQLDLQGAFRALFLDGRADGLEPIQALAMFYDFRELTPIGGDGDLMVRRLAQRLVDVDLLDKAAELLRYQMDNRLDGVPKAQVAADLATIYMMDRKPEMALQAINSSRTTVLPAPLTAERRLLEARAWLALNNIDHAVELIGTDSSPDALDLRAEVAWRRKDWPVAGAGYEKALGARWQSAGPLEPFAESRLLRAGVAYSLAQDEGALQRLSTQYGALIDTAQSADALRVALTGFNAGLQINPGTFTRIAAQDDAFAGWVAKMKQRFKEKPAPVVGPKPKMAAASTAAAG